MYDNFCNDIRFNEGESMHHVQLLLKDDRNLPPGN